MTVLLRVLVAASVVLLNVSAPPVAHATTNDELRAQQVVLTPMWESNPQGWDRMSTSNQAEASSTGIRGQTWYVPVAPSASRSPLYRLFYPAANDHMDSGSPGEGPYALEGTLGYPWHQSSAPRGTAQMYRTYSSSTGDHTTPSPHFDETAYSNRDYLGLYGYPRFGAGVSLRALQGSELRVASNLAAGGQGWELNWGGKQFLETRGLYSTDYGRGMQASLHVGDALPTEGGDQSEYPDNRYMHGSPLVEMSSTPNAQTTSAVPLDFQPELWGGSAKNPVAYPSWRLGKTITLDRVGLGPEFGHLNGQVAKYTTRFSHPSVLQHARVEIPSIYLKSEFNRAFTFDATNPDINAGATEHPSLPSLGPNFHHFQHNLAESGGVILANAALSHAVGIYGSKRSGTGDVDASGASVDYMVIDRFGPDQAAPDVTKLAAGWAGNLEAGTHEFHTYVVAGSYNDVRVAMRRLFIEGYR